MSVVILQTPSTYETRSIHTASMLLDHVRVINSSIQALPQLVGHLSNGAQPVGSVEFVRAAMNIAGLKEPPAISYPPSSRQYWHRNIDMVSATNIHETCFVKPVNTKLFNGFVFDPGRNISEFDDHDREQYAIFKSLDSSQMVWKSDICHWQSEWRFYIAYGEIIGQARYDDGKDSALVPNLRIVQNCINDMKIAHPYALDMGVLDDGKTALVEVNDAWAIGLYGKALAPRNYFAFLRSRWRDLLVSNSQS